MRGWLIPLLIVVVLVAFGVGFWDQRLHTSAFVCWLLAFGAFIWFAVQVSLWFRILYRRRRRRHIVDAPAVHKSFLESIFPGASMPDGYNDDRKAWDENDSLPRF